MSPPSSPPLHIRRACILTMDDQRSIVEGDVLIEEGIGIEQLENVHAPIGLDIGAVTPQEIAVAIVAELIAVRRSKTDKVAGASLRWMPKLQVPEVR